MSVACLPMYDLPEVRGASDAFWAGLAGHLRSEGLDDVPDRLTHDRSVTALPGNPNLRFGQCCGSDIVGNLGASFRLVATPNYSAHGCSGPDYVSFVVVQEDNRATRIADLRGAVCAINGPHSHSGAYAFYALLARSGATETFFSQVDITGSHVASIDRVRDGIAAVAAIDCVTWALVERHRPEALRGLRVLSRTEAAPGLPYITSSAANDDELARMRTAVFATFADRALADARDALLLKDIEVLPRSAYDRIAVIRDIALGTGLSEDTAGVVQGPAR